MAKEFEVFVSRGNVVDLAVGVVIGAAFGKIVSSLVNNIIMPLIGLLLGGMDFSGLSFSVGSAVVTYGVFIQNIVDFLFIAAGVFVFVKLINSINRHATANTTKVKDTAVAKKEDDQLKVLQEIRDELRKNNVQSGEQKDLR
ncbi:MAG: large conductance mechanosensitive channel protein MscL [Candidatus Nomurabacteria bacterium]|nr:large conductance mechanosensitive channel protein MscL [Candidatus Nomurabacteria bacterium]